ncbi:MAG: hypothetical protein A3B75_00145 [Candidatus Terrybacteria bacterium RIFCSPHIGHO2_02_FULL_43_14]|nr:MAG: hypothetical protein A3B75_00145 [Candidatus Terrybacteria bacterium RIFCSPHIGHO2_02_FULL_43_14]
MPVPKQRHTKGRRNRRRSHHALSVPTLAQCSHCGKMVLPHRVCMNCGYYGSREVFNPLAKKAKKDKKRKEREAKLAKAAGKSV